MAIFLITFTVMLLVVLGMSVGVIVSGKTIKGSCGGLNTIDGIDRVCDCEDPCETKQKALANKDEAVITFRKI